MFLSKVEGSPSLELVNLVLAKMARGEKVLSLAIGDPSSNTPKEIADTAYQAMLSGNVHYVSSYGTREVREAICRKVERTNGIRAHLDNAIFLSTKFSVYAALMAVSDGPYEALLPDPGYFYSEPVLLSGGTPVYYPLASDFSLDLEQIRKATTRRTRAILINTPSNPTGRVLSRGQLEELYAFCKEKKIYIISDEAYEDLVYEGNTHFAVGALEASSPELVVSLFSLSKSYSMTGWRAGYVVGSERIVHLINKFIENTMTCFPPFIQKAAEYALNNGDRWIWEFRKEYAQKRKFLLEKVSQIEKLQPNAVQGAFYMFPRFKAQWNSAELCKRILQEKGVALLPGSAFGRAGEGRIRLSFSGSMEVMEEAMSKLRDFFAEN